MKKQFVTVLRGVILSCEFMLALERRLGYIAMDAIYIHQEFPTDYNHTYPAFNPPAQR